MALKETKLVALLCMLVIAGRFALDSYLPSLPSIARDFGSNGSEVQLTLSLYHLGFGSSQFIYGPLSDFFGRRKTLLIGLTIFVLSGILCSLSSSIVFLILSRFLAGIGAGAGSTLSRAIVADVYDETEISKTWARITSALMISLMIAPLVGGYIQESIGWRYNFVISTAYALLVLLLIFMYLPETLKVKKEANLKVIVQTYIKLTSNTKFIGYILCSTLSFAGLAIYFQVSPFIFMERMGFSPSQFGWCSLSIAMCYILSGILVNRWVSKLGIFRMLSLGVLFILLGGGVMLSLWCLELMSFYMIFLPILLYVIGARIVIPNATAGSLFFGKSSAGIAAALVGGIQMLGCSFISFIVAKVDYSHEFILAVTFSSVGILSVIILKLFISKKEPIGRTETDSI